MSYGRQRVTCARAARRLLLTIAAVGVAAAALPASGHAQIAWDTPRMVGPESPTGIGAYWIRSHALGPEMNAFMGMMPLPGSGGAISLRGGVGKDENDDLSFFGGLDLRATIARHTDTQPLDLEWSAGIGFGMGTTNDPYGVVSMPTAISAGRSWASGSVWLAPYVSLGAALDLYVGSEGPEDEFTLRPSADIGLDLSLDAARRFVFRAAASLGDRHAVSVGLNVGGARR